MTKNFTCCHECYKDLNKIIHSLGEAWLILCEFWLKLGEKPLIYQRSEALEIPLYELEVRGFILTTDQNDDIAVKLGRYIIDADGLPFFCSKKDCHHV